MEPFILERIYKARIELVWKAITDKGQMKQWYFDLPDFKLEINNIFEWSGGPPDGKQWLHRGKIIEIIDGKKLVYTWEYPGHKGLSTVIWELCAIDKNTTKLNFMHQFNIPFDPKEEALRRENFAEGWNYILPVSLTEYIHKISK